MLLPCALAQEANAEFDERFTAGMAALRADETSKAFRAFTKCRELAELVAPERRPAAMLAAELFVAETTMLVGQVEGAEVHDQVLELTAAAVSSGAWAQSGCEALRLRALVLRWRTAPFGAFRSDLPATDRAWLLRDDFFEIEPRRMADLHDVARVLRFSLAQGTATELAMLRELMRAEAAAGPEWRHVMRGTLANYHMERRSFDRAQIYVDRMPPEESVLERALLALQREDHTVAEKLARQLIGANNAQGEQLLADVLEASHRWAEALPHYDKALAIARDPASKAAAQNGRGDCLLALDRGDEARVAYDAALESCDGDTVGLIAERAETEKDLGRLAEARSEGSLALQHYRNALEIGESVRERLLDDAFGGSWLRIHADQTTAIDGILRLWPSHTSAWPAVHALELGRARGALDLTSRRGSGIDPGELQRLVRRRLEATDVADIEAVAVELELLRVVSDRGRSMARVPSEVRLREFATDHGDTTILSWWFGREQAWLVVVRGREAKKFDLGYSADCRRQVAAAWRAVASPDGEVAALTTAAEMLLPAAVRESLTDVVLAIVDPTMVRLPVAALMVDGEPFGVRHTVVQAPSLAVAELLHQGVGEGVGVVVVEAPERTRLTDRLGLDPLRFAARECSAVVAAHGGGVHLAGDDATLDNVRSRGFPPPDHHPFSKSPDLLHIAAHAIDCPGFPTQSLLLLADGPHAMGNFGSLAIPGTLVVLSACAAATGEQRGHEGAVGLVEGMFAAGARGVVAPFAAVNQQATADFMKVFHEAVSAGHEPAVALRHARRTLAAADNYTHPHYWGAFTLFGAIPSSAAAPVRSYRTAIWLLCGVLIALGVVMLLPRKQRGVGLR